MGNGCMKSNANTYFNARKEASNYNERLCSREGAAEMLGISVSTLADYELGITKVVPVDKVVLMSEMYHCPELKAHYCKNECPIGRSMQIATEVRGVESLALRMIRQFDNESIDRIKKEFAEIAEGGVITDNEKPKLKEILEKLNDISEVISEMKLLGEKVL